MTPKEAIEAARQMLPIEYEGAVYTRITEIGICYNDKSEGQHFVKLLDKNGNSVVYASPQKCNVKGAKNEHTTV